jgi:hypothetical protein
VDAGKALKENKAAFSNLSEMSSLLDVLNSPLAMVLKETIPFAPLVLTILKQLQHEPSLEECVALIAQAAYLESWQAELKRQPDWLENVDRNRSSATIERKLKAVGEIESYIEASTSILHKLPSSKLVSNFNDVLITRIEELGINTLDAQLISARVAQNTPRYLPKLLAESAKEVEILAEFYKNGGAEIDRFYADIDDYLQTKIVSLPDMHIFNEMTEPKLKEIFISLDIQTLDQDGKQKKESPISIGKWAIIKLLDPVSKKILFVQGEAGRGKSAFCQIFAEHVHRKLPFTPILIRLRDLIRLESTLPKTLESHLHHWGFTRRRDWLTNKNQQFLFIFDGFDELLMQGMATGGLKDFLGQVQGLFNEDCHHRCLITGRPLALQGLERSAWKSECLERVELLKMNNSHHDTWLNKWQSKFKISERIAFEQFLKACPKDIYDRDRPQENNTNLVGEPLMLYLLARMHRDGAIQSAELANTAGLQAKAKIYDRAVDWVLNRQRDKLNQQMIDSVNPDKLPELRQLMREVAVCVMQSGNEMSKVSSIESRLSKDTNDSVRQIYDEMSKMKQPDGEARVMNTFLTAFYLQPAAGDKEGSVEFSHKSFGEFLFAEHLKEAISDWSSSIIIRKRVIDQIKQEDLEWQIYDLLGYGCLTPEIFGYLWAMLESSDDWQPLRLFERLNEFWESWCEGKFIDSPPENLPQKKMRLLREQMPDRSEMLGIRQVDVYTGLNILTLLLTLNSYQIRNSLKDQIIFDLHSPEYESRLRKVIHYSESISLLLFQENICSYLSRVNLSNADLRHANLSRANLSHADLYFANLSHANLSRANLSHAKLYFADLSGANLGGADLSGADLSDAYLSGADLSGADLSGADLSGADLSGANLKSITRDTETNWSKTTGLDTTINMPISLKKHLKLF